VPSARAAHRNEARISVISVNFCVTIINTLRVSDQRFMQLCMRKVETKAVMTVRMKLPSFSALGILKIFIFV